MNVYAEISKYLLSHETVNVVIAGITCSGKTTLANNIREYFSDKYVVTIVAQDDYFKNLPDIPRVREGYLTDSIEAFWTAEFKQDVQKLLIDGVVTTPKYDIASNIRICKNKIVREGTINIFEGLHTIRLLGKLDNCIKIFVDTDIDICLKRRIARDTSTYGVPEERIRRYWDTCIKPMYEKWIRPQRENADIIINRKGGECDGTQTNL